MNDKYLPNNNPNLELVYYTLPDKDHPRGRVWVCPLIGWRVLPLGRGRHMVDPIGSVEQDFEQLYFTLNTVTGKVCSYENGVFDSIAAMQDDYAADYVGESK